MKICFPSCCYPTSRPPEEGSPQASKASSECLGQAVGYLALSPLFVGGMFKTKGQALAKLHLSGQMGRYYKSGGAAVCDCLVLAYGAGTLGSLLKLAYPKLSERAQHLLGACVAFPLVWYLNSQMGYELSWVATALAGATVVGSALSLSEKEKESCPELKN